MSASPLELVIEGARLRAECVAYFIDDYRAGRGRPALSAAAFHARGLVLRVERGIAELEALDTERKAQHVARTLRGGT